MRTSTLLVLASLTYSTCGLKTGDWKTCAQSGFCRRGRALSARAKAAGAGWNSPYSVDSSSISTDGSTLQAAVKSSLYPEIKFSLDLRVHEDGVVRLRMDEVDGLRKRYDETASWALISEPTLSDSITWSKGSREAKAQLSKGVEVLLQYQPLKVTLIRNGVEQVVLNGKGLLHMEHFKKKANPPAVEGTDPAAGDAQTPVSTDSTHTHWFEGETQDDWWEERFLNWEDAKPKGPESLSLDINFPNHGHVFGIPQHATSLSLPTTTGEDSFFNEPYRLYNTDVFEYLASSPMSLYGSIPVMHAHSADSTVAVFDAVASETWIDVAHPSASSTETHWVSESGILDVFIMPGPTPEAIFAQWAKLTGAPVLPSIWSLGHHQCRWNYISSEDVREVQRKFDEEDIPVDVFWLDIDYATDHKYMIYDKKLFPDPVEMVNDVAATGRKMVVIVDPHIKRANDYPVYQEASKLEIFVKPKSGEGEFEGWCWPGSSSWVDFFNPTAWKWWIGLFNTKAVAGRFTWTDSTENVHIWNDMNEPSVFNGPEITMPKDNIHYGGWEHRDVHNVNGMLFPNITSQALLARSDPPKRPFVLTRSFYAGSQRFGAMWTGDNMGTWEHMTVGLKMVLANGIGGLSFAGADVGGFFGNPEPEMLVRWYQLGAFNTFFRAHAHIDTKRREPYLFPEPYKSMMRNILRLRYTLTPVWYTAFRETSVTGIPVLRPHYIVFPKDTTGFAIDDQFYVGSSGLLVKPITQEGQRETSVYFAESQVYYDYFNYNVYRGATGGKSYTVKAELDQIPLFIRGGSIVPTRERPRRSTTSMKLDPFTLRIALSKSYTAKGDLYLDDGDSFSHEKGDLIWRGFEATHPSKTTIRISSTDLATANPEKTVDNVSLSTYNPANSYAQTIKDVNIERFVILGVPSKPKRVAVEGGEEMGWTFSAGASANGKKDGQASILTIKRPKLLITKDWSIVIDL